MAAPRGREELLVVQFGNRLQRTVPVPVDVIAADSLGVVRLPDVTAIESLPDRVVHRLLKADATCRHPVTDHLLGVEREFNRSAHAFTITAAHRPPGHRL